MKKLLRFLLCATFAVGFSTGAFAQATRTWVSGVGDDANPCSRTAPCKTFAGAISKTAEGGEIDALDPAGYGTLTVTKSITVDGGTGSGWASVLNTSVNGFNINVTANPAGSVVILRNITIQGASKCTTAGCAGVKAIRVTAGDRLFVLNCHIENQSTNGIEMVLGTTGTVFVQDTDFSNVGTGIAASTTAGTAIVEANRISIMGTTSGINLTTNAFAHITESFFSRCIGGNALSVASGSTANVTQSHFFSNSTAVNALAGSTVRVNACEIFDNVNGFAGNAASIQSGGNNKLAGNTGSITPTGPALTTQ